MHMYYMNNTCIYMYIISIHEAHDLNYSIRDVKQRLDKAPTMLHQFYPGLKNESETPKMHNDV